jgi:hypothetical protein
MDVRVSGAGLPDFLDTIYQNSEKYTKVAQHYQMTIKYTKWPQNVSNDLIIYTDIFHST